VIQDEWMLAKFEASSTAEGVVALLEDTIGAFQKDITRAKLSIASILWINEARIVRLLSVYFRRSNLFETNLFSQFGYVFVRFY
jgi:hypothetical protein